MKKEIYRQEIDHVEWVERGLNSNWGVGWLILSTLSFAFYLVLIICAYLNFQILGGKVMYWIALSFSILCVFSLSMFPIKKKIVYYKNIPKEK